MQSLKMSELIGSCCASIIANIGFMLVAFFYHSQVILWVGLAYDALFIYVAFNQLLLVIADEKKNDAFIADVRRKRALKTTGKS